MGIYDRDYMRRPRSRFTWPGPQTAVGMLVLINAALYLVDRLFLSGEIASRLAVHADTLFRPWDWWQFLTYGFVHAEWPAHVVLNMFVLWMFGRDVEAVYGRAEFLRVYLVMLVAGSLGWAVLNRLEAPGVDYELIGASGAVVGIFVLFCLNFPRRTVLLFFVLPVPAWVAGLLLIIPDVFGAVAMPNSNIAFTVHLIGAALALLYFRARWNFGRLWPRRISWPWHWSWPRSGPRFRVHDPDPDDAGPQDQELSAEVDRILEKIHREGEASLTARERRTLEDASRRYQEKRRGPP